MVPILEHKTIPFHGKLLFEKAKICPPFKLPNPMQNEACFLYVLEGKCVALSETDSIEANPPDAFLMKCGNFYNFCVPSEEQPHYHAVAVHFHPEVLKKVYESELPSFLLEKENTSKRTFAKVEMSSLLFKYIESILFFFEHPELASEDLLKLKVKELLLLLNESSNGDKIRELLSSLFVPTTIQIQDVVSAHLYEDISVRELAFLSHMSESTFKREFKKHYKDSPAHYFKIKKLERANKLLSLGNSVSNAAFESGFNDLAHFSKSFKEHFGVAPSKVG